MELCSIGDIPRLPRLLELLMFSSAINAFLRNRRTINLLRAFTAQREQVEFSACRTVVHSNSDNGNLPLLYIDDSENERLLVREAILLTKIPFAFYQADGMESAMLYFQSHGHDGEPKQFPRPALVLLDHDLGNHSGTDFLYWLRLIKNITSIPVVMFSGSAGQPHVAECYATGANYFLRKPKDLTRLKIIVHKLYLSLVSLHRPGPIQLLEEYQADPREHPTATVVWNKRQHPGFGSCPATNSAHLDKRL